jgi:4-hydroxythreonine-4-phosphate dehydrogenase
MLAREASIQETCFDPTSMKITPLKMSGDTLVRLPNKMKMDSDAARFALAYFLAPHIHHAGALVLTGGDTARAVLQTIGVNALRVWGEAEPGVPFSTAMGAWEGTVITKAGSFGDPSTLMRCRAALKSSKLG